MGLPLSFYLLGLPLAFLVNVIAIGVTILSAKLYLAIKDALPDKPESFYEIGYMLVGRPAIFIIASLLIIMSLGLCIIYFIVFGDTFG